MSAQFTYWQDPADGKWLGYWNDYPDYRTEGYTLDDLRYMLGDIRDAIRDGDLPDTAVGHNVGVMEFA